MNNSVLQIHDNVDKNNVSDWGVTLEKKLDKLLGRDVSPELITKNIFGSVLFFIIVIGLVPFLLFKFKLYDFLEVYFPNVDLIATSLSFDGGPFNLEIFKYLYMDESPFIGYLNKNIISYIALMSVIFIVIRAAVVHKNVSVGLAKASIICFTTYLLPNRYIMSGMTLFDHMFSRIMSGPFVWFIVAFVGLIISCLCIFCEALLIKYFSPGISKFLIDILKDSVKKSKKHVSSEAVQRIFKK
jgi:hypothetical protein